MSMTDRSVRNSIRAAAMVCGMLTVVIGGPVAVVAATCAGFGVTCWAAVYAQVLCAGERLSWERTVVAGGWGSAAAVTVAPLFLAFETPVVLVAAAGLALWMVSVTPSGHPADGAPHRTASRLASLLLGR